MHVSYQSNLYVMEGTFLLELVPLLLKDVERLGHGELLQEVSNKKKKPDSIQIVITGRPNSGKSTFINSILGKQRVLTGPEAGITRESIEIKWEYKNYNLKIVDSLGNPTYVLQLGALLAGLFVVAES